MQKMEGNNQDAAKKTGPLVSVIVVARDEEWNIRQCLSGVVSQKVDFTFEILVIDSGSKDRTVEVARSFGARVMEIPPSSFQHGRTRQEASEEAGGKLLVYIVADAAPANEYWLARLVGPLMEDEAVAGSFSRQLPREGAGVLEAMKIKHRVSAGEERKVRRISADLDFWSLSPEERLRFCEFDDVSCCRRKSVLKEHPIPSVDWAEDLLWSREVLLAGYKIVYEPKSIVRHSHTDTLSHAFCRGYLDQGVVLENFGVLYFDTVRAWARGFMYLYRQQTGYVFGSGQGLQIAVTISFLNFFRLFFETLGNFLASRRPRTRNVAVSLAPRLKKKNILKKRHRRQVLLTRFCLGADTRPVLFMNPGAAAVIKQKVPPGARLEFGAGINPAARPLRRAPILFIVAVNGEPVWSREIKPGKPGQKPVWEEGDISLARWGGKKVRLAFITRSANTDYGWAGWARPLITIDRLCFADRMINRFLDAVNRRVKGVPLRHP